MLALRSLPPNPMSCALPCTGTVAWAAAIQRLLTLSLLPVGPSTCSSGFQETQDHPWLCLASSLSPYIKASLRLQRKVPAASSPTVPAFRRQQQQQHLPRAHHMKRSRAALQLHLSEDWCVTWSARFRPNTEQSTPCMKKFQPMQVCLQVKWEGVLHEKNVTYKLW